MAKSNFKSWYAYQKAFELSMQIFKLSFKFPKEEKYSLTDQIRRSSRSVCANLAEGYAKKSYPKHFIAKLTDAAGENYETQTWLEFAMRSGYITPEVHLRLTVESEEVGKLLSYMQSNSSNFK